MDDCIRADLYHTAGAAVTNFAEKLPAMQGELAQEILKSNYDLGFVSLPDNGPTGLSRGSINFKNKANYCSLHEQDYYKTQGLAFIMLVSALIHQEFEAACEPIKGKSAQTCLLEARMVKVYKRHDKWIVCNLLKKQNELFKQLNTVPTISALVHT